MNPPLAPVPERFDQIQTIIESDEIPKEYFNGFSLTIGSGDVILILMRNNKPIRTLQASYTVAKTLAQGLTSAMLALEEITGNEIMTTHFIEEKLKAGANDKS